MQLVPSGRLLIPAYGGAGTHQPVSYTYYSDDGGDSWRLSPEVPFSAGTAEPVLAQVPGAATRVAFNFRIENSTMSGCGDYKHCRASSFSDDGGITWSIPRAEPSLPVPACKGGIASGAADGECGSDSGDWATVTLEHRDSTDVPLKFVRLWVS